MELVNSYLSELQQHLPSDQREDIISELRDNIVEEIDERAASRGGDPDSNDERAVLANLGHPLKVAGEYKTQRYLIGPELFPAFLQTLRSALLIGFLVVFLLRVAGGLEGEFASLSRSLLGNFFEVGVWIVGVVGLIFVALEATGEKLSWYHDWSPDDLQTNARAVDYSATVSNLLFEGFFLLCWNSALSLDFGMDEKWLDAHQLAPIWQTLFWPINFVMVAFLALHVFVLARGAWHRVSAGFELGLCVGFLVLIGIVLGAESLVVSELNEGSSVGYPSVEWLDRTVRIALAVIAGLTVWDGVLAYRRAR